MYILSLLGPYVRFTCVRSSFILYQFGINCVLDIMKLAYMCSDLNAAYVQGMCEDCSLCTDSPTAVLKVHVSEFDLSY